MDESGSKTVQVCFLDHALTFYASEYSDRVLKGFFHWNDAVKEDLLERENKFREENGEWYLDNDGYRLPFEELFPKSPWTLLLEGQTPQKIISRFMDFNTGEAWFAIQPWARIGSEYNQPPKK